MSVTVTEKLVRVYIPGVKTTNYCRGCRTPTSADLGFKPTGPASSPTEKAGSAPSLPSTRPLRKAYSGEDNAPVSCASGFSCITHTAACTRLGTRNGATFQFDRTPPATNAGPDHPRRRRRRVNGDANLTGDFIDTSNIELILSRSRPDRWSPLVPSSTPPSQTAIEASPQTPGS